MYRTVNSSYDTKLSLWYDDDIFIVYDVSVPLRYLTYVECQVNIPGLKYTQQFLSNIAIAIAYYLPY